MGFGKLPDIRSRGKGSLKPPVRKEKSPKINFWDESYFCPTRRDVPCVFPRLCATPTPASHVRYPPPSAFSAGPFGF